ncbi:MAG: hypothetical protein JO155_13565 [Acidimicrobiia bacterium]|nr:hypothetical protein [Acidimicrobiia bacterium]
MSDAPPASQAPDAQAAGPSMVPSVRMLLPNIVVAGVLPVVGYALLRPHVDSDAVALAIVLVFPVAEILYERIRRGRFEPIGVIALVGISLGLIGALVFSGDATLLKVRQSVLTGAFGVLCLLSLAAPRPAMFYMGRMFATGGDPERMAEFEEIWQLPTVPRRFRIVTLVWGVGLTGEAIFRTILALTIPTQTFLIVSEIVNWSVLGGLLWYSFRANRTGERQVVDMLEATD